MWEVSECIPPFSDRAHDGLLALDICRGLRPISEVFNIIYSFFFSSTICIFKSNCNEPKLLRFRGRPQELSPKARILQWASKIFPSLGTPPPFDRHDWTIDRCGREVRYVIDYYSAPDEGDNPVFYLDVRPALDSIDSVVDRIKVATKETFAQLRERAKAARQENEVDRS
ncbi:unnamed protein product [Rhizophagus irregularis]|nr:unnamed protein product [Rhizophagus irregularis]